MPLNKGLLNKYLNDYFVETGTYMGNGVEEARRARFKKIISIELGTKLADKAKARFQHDPRITIVQGDSGKILGEVISSVTSPITFWLDGHYSAGITARGETNTPILGELRAIANHPIKDHTILIDDVRGFGTDGFDGIRLETIVDIIKEINPNYRILYEDGFIPGDVLVAIL